MPPLDAFTIKRLKEIFDKMDTDGSDDLDYSELKVALKTSGIDMSLGDGAGVRTHEDGESIHCLVSLHASPSHLSVGRAAVCTADLKKLWTAADKDASSGLSFEEFVAAVGSMDNKDLQEKLTKPAELKSEPSCTVM
jgi:hypothetical protein